MNSRQSSWHFQWRMLQNRESIITSLFLVHNKKIEKKSFKKYSLGYARLILGQLWIIVPIISKYFAGNSAGILLNKWLHGWTVTSLFLSATFSIISGTRFQQNIHQYFYENPERKNGITINRKKYKTKPSRFEFKDSVLYGQFNEIFHKAFSNPKWLFFLNSEAQYTITCHWNKNRLKVHFCKILSPVRSSDTTGAESSMLIWNDRKFQVFAIWNPVEDF